MGTSGWTQKVPVVSGRQPALDGVGAVQTAVPPWEDPIHRFLHGEGELKIVVKLDGDITSNAGPCFTLFEALRLPPLYFPLRIGEKHWSRGDLWFQTALLLQSEPWTYVEHYGWQYIRQLQECLIANGLLEPAQTELVGPASRQR